MGDYYSATALHHAAQRGDAKIVRSVLEHMATQADADLNAVDRTCETALMVAIGQTLDSKTYAEFVMVCITLIEAGWEPFILDSIP